MAEIRMDVDFAREKVQEIEGSKEQLNDLVSTLSRIIEVELAENWAGETQAKFDQQFDDIKQGPLKDIEQLLTDLSAQLGQIVDSLETLDKDMASKVGLK